MDSLSSPDGRVVDASYLVDSEDVLCCILDIDHEDIVVIINLLWGRQSVEKHVMAHLDYGVVGVALCAPGCPGPGR